MTDTGKQGSPEMQATAQAIREASMFAGETVDVTAMRESMSAVAACCICMAGVMCWVRSTLMLN